MVSKFDKSINTIIEEMMGFSPSSDKLGNEILDYIDNEVKAGNIKKIDDPDEDLEGGELYTIDNFVTQFTVDGKTNVYALEINLVNYPEDFDKNRLYEIACEQGNASCALASGDEDKSVAFVIKGTLIFRNWKLTKFNRGVFHHEVKHAFTHIKTIGDKELDTYLKKPGMVSLRNIYNAATQLMDNPLLRLIMPEVANLTKTVYVTDTQEMSSFTQQAYKAMEDVTSFQEADKTLRETELYKISKFLDGAIEAIEEDSNLYDKFAEILQYGLDPDTKMPTKSAYLKMLKKRAHSYRTRVGKLLVFTKDRLREEALKEGYRVPLILHDTNWVEAYKLNLY